VEWNAKWNIEPPGHRVQNRQAETRAVASVRADIAVCKTRVVKQLLQAVTGIAEVVMRLLVERPVERRGKNEPAPGLENPPALLQQARRVGYMLEHLCAEDEIDAL